MKAERIKFTKHAADKFQLLTKYGFSVTEANVKDTIAKPARVEQRNNQTLATKPLDSDHALRVVYRRINDNIVVVTFYPVRRQRVNV